MAVENPEIHETETRETQRLEAFSDGVFAIAITLLVLEIRLPASESEGHLLDSLLQIWPSYLGYIISFITIGIMWTNHDSLLRHIKQADRAFMLLNALLLMLITFLNFPTVILAEHLQSSDANIAAMFYSGTFFVIALFYNALWWYARSNPHLLSAKSSLKTRDIISRQYLFGPLSYLAAFILGIFSPLLSVVLVLAVAVYWAVLGSRGNQA